MKTLRPTERDLARAAFSGAAVLAKWVMEHKDAPVPRRLAEHIIASLLAEVGVLTEMEPAETLANLKMATVILEDKLARGELPPDSALHLLRPATAPLAGEELPPAFKDFVEFLDMDALDEDEK